MVLHESPTSPEGLIHSNPAVVTLLTWTSHHWVPILPLILANLFASLCVSAVFARGYYIVGEYGTVCEFGIFWDVVLGALTALPPFSIRIVRHGKSSFGILQL
jgi:hypothetical protein